MRATAFILLLLALILGSSAMALSDTPSVNLQINGQQVYPEVPPYIQDGRTMVPLRFIGDSCGMLVDWDANLRRVTVIGETTALRLDIGSNIAYVNGVETPLEVEAQIKDGRTMVPLRFIMENLAAQVEWDEYTRTVSLSWDLNPALPSPAMEAIVEPPIQPRAGIISGYYFDSNSWAMLQEYYADFDTAIHFAYKIYADGSLAAKNYNSGWNTYAEPLLTEHGILKLLLITDFGDPQNERIEGSPQLLADGEARSRGVANIAALLQQTGADGVDIDFEKLDNASRDNFTAFIRELKAALGPKLVTISLPPKRSDNESWLNKFDYQALGEAADRLHIMFYDQHHGASGPGPIASPAWLGQGLDYLLQLVPREKLHVMLGLYGRAWRGEAHVSSVNLPRVQEIISEYGATAYRDEATGIPYLTYQDDDGLDMVLWYEDAISLGQKAAIAREYGVGGLGIWRMGILPDDLWRAIVDNFSRQ